MQMLSGWYGLTLRQLAAMLGHSSHSYVTNLERGERKPSAEMAVKIAETCYMYYYTYNIFIKFEWDEAKQQSNLRKHCLDFADAEPVFAGVTFTFEDDRFEYSEVRYITLGLLRGAVVVIAHTEREEVIRDQCERQRKMSTESTLKGSQTDWEALEKMNDEDIDLSEIPEVTAEQIAQAMLRVGGKPVSRGKVRVNIYLDAEVVEYFKAKAGGRGYQTLINETLKESIRAKGIEMVLRRVIREEMNVAS